VPSSDKAQIKYYGNKHYDQVKRIHGLTRLGQPGVCDQCYGHENEPEKWHQNRVVYASKEIRQEIEQNNRNPRKCDDKDSK